MERKKEGNKNRWKEAEKTGKMDLRKQEWKKGIRNEKLR